MKKLFVVILLAGLVLTGKTQDELIAGWTFPGNNLMADTGLAINADAVIETFGGTAEIELKNGYETKAAQAAGWHDGANTKGWIITVNTLGYEGITISSRQQSGGNDPGPKFFKIQVSTDEGVSWLDVEGADVTVENDWETSFVDALPLPESAGNLEALAIRWLMTSNEASGGAGTVLESGKSKIDEIFIHGSQINALSSYAYNNFMVGPNPVNSFLTVAALQPIHRIEVLNIRGQLLRSQQVNSNSITIDLHDVNESICFLRVFGLSNEVLHIQKIIKNR